MQQHPDDHPCFHISIVAQMLNLHPQTIRNYERMGLVNPSRTDGNMRLFSQEDVSRMEKIHSYTTAGVNLAGVEIIMKLLDQMEEMRQEIEICNKEKLQEIDEACRHIIDI